MNRLSEWRIAQFIGTTVGTPHTTVSTPRRYQHFSVFKSFYFSGRYGRLTPLEMEEVHKRLDDFYYPDTQTLLEHFSLHVQAHNTALLNDMPFSERDKVAKLRGSLLRIQRQSTHGRDNFQRSQFIRRSKICKMRYKLRKIIGIA